MWYNLFSHLSDALCGRAGAALRWALLFGGDVQSVSQSVGGETRRGGGEDRKAGWTEQKRFGSPCVADFVWRKKESGWEIPELSSLWNGFYLFGPLVMCTPCCIAQVSNNSRPWLTVVWVRVCLLLFSGLKRCNNETCSTLTLSVLFTVFCPRLSPFTVG